MGEQQPQQPELRRSERGETTQDGRQEMQETREGGKDERPRGKVPPENRPGHHPEQEQDKPAPPE